MLIAMNLCPLMTKLYVCKKSGVALPPSFRKPRTLKSVDVILKFRMIQHNYPSTRPRGSPSRVATIYLCIAQVSFEDPSDCAQPDQKHMLKRRAARTQKTVDGVLCARNCKDLKTL